MANLKQNFNQIMSYNKYLINKIGISNYLTIHEYFSCRNNYNIPESKIFSSGVEWIYNNCLLIPKKQYLLNDNLDILFKFQNYCLCAKKDLP